MSSFTLELSQLADCNTRVAKSRNIKDNPRIIHYSNRIYDCFIFIFSKKWWLRAIIVLYEGYSLVSSLLHNYFLIIKLIL